MRWLALAARVLVGLGFLVFGLNYFAKVIPIPPAPTASAGAYLGLLAGSGYLTVVKVLEVVGGALVLSGRYTPAGLVLVTPVAVNVALYEVCLIGGPGPGVVLTVLCGLLVAYYWRHFAGAFAPAAVV